MMIARRAFLHGATAASVRAAARKPNIIWIMVFGKWGLGALGTEGVPSKKGFDEFTGYLHQVHAHFFYPEFLIRNDRRDHERRRRKPASPSKI